MRQKQQKKKKKQLCIYDESVYYLYITNGNYIICNKEYKLKKNGTIKDIIPTIVDVYEISKPKEMTGESLIIKQISPDAIIYNNLLKCYTMLM